MDPASEKVYSINASSSNKKSILCCPLIKIYPHIFLELFWTVFDFKLCLVSAYFFPDSPFSLEKATEYTYFSRKQFEGKMSWWIYYKHIAFHFKRC